MSMSNEGGAAVVPSRFWIGWYEPVDEAEDPRPLTWPLPNGVQYWISGWRGDMSAATMVAVVDAATEEAAKKLIESLWKPDGWRFCEEQEPGWMPPPCRFPPGATP
jgi:hypothetical protein